MSEMNQKGSPDSESAQPERNNGRRLPPPAFPPGSRRGSVRRSLEKGALSDAFISPDDPLPERSGVPDDAFISPDAPFERASLEDVSFISPDDPIPHRDPHPAAVADEEAEEDEDFDPDDVVVTGMGDDAHLDPTELAFAADPHVFELVTQVSKLAEALKQKGEAGLRSTPDMSRFEATLRAYCVGYLAGRRAEDEQD